jgi:hypothetical protein
VVQRSQRVKTVSGSSFTMPLTPPDSFPDESASHGSSSSSAGESPMNHDQHNDSLLMGCFDGGELKDLVTSTTDWFDSNAVEDLSAFAH